MRHYVTIGRTTFDKEQALSMGFEAFKKAYEPILKASYMDAWKALGGKIDKPKPKKDEVREA